MNEPKESALVFEGYLVNELHYELNEKWVSGERVKFKLDFEEPYIKQISENKSSLRFSLSVFGFQEGKKVLDTRVVATGVFANQGLEESKYREIMLYSGTATLFSIIRGVIASYSSQTGGPHIVIPLINVLDTIDDFKGDKEKNRSQND